MPAESLAQESPGGPGIQTSPLAAGPVFAAILGTWQGALVPTGFPECGAGGTTMVSEPPGPVLCRTHLTQSHEEQKIKEPN